MRFRAVLAQDRVNTLSNVVNAFLRAAKSGITEKISPTSTQLNIKFSLEQVLIRYCTTTTFDRTQIFAVFDVDEIFSELLLESRYQNIIGIVIDAKCLASALKAGAKAHRTVTKLSRRADHRSLSFQFSIMGEGDKAIKVCQDCVIDILPGATAAEITAPPQNLIGENIEIRSLQSMRGVVDRMRRIGVESIGFSVTPTALQRCQPGISEDQRLCELRLSGSTDFAILLATYNRCLMHTFVEDEKQDNSVLNSSQASTKTIDYNINGTQKELLKEPKQDSLFQTFPLKNIHLVLQMEKAHIVCVTAATVVE